MLNPDGTRAFARRTAKVDNNMVKAVDADSKLIQVVNIQSAPTATPSEEFVRLVASDLIENKRITATVREQFTLITKYAFEQLISEKINERLKGAMEKPTTLKIEAETKDGTNVIESEEGLTSGIVTTREELDAYYIVRAIVRSALPVDRVFMRDQQSYCSIIVDDNNRKPLCRLRFNSIKNLAIGIFNEQKIEETIKITSLDDIYSHADKLISIAKYYADGVDFK
jgi:hypothetical protein